ncbi:ras and Rab interactor 1-like [Salarias fasciatus]|uniref:ras and Rab interactor 1-like n=1 Tax=Salarias fasciatus TaxID=181472 RepID=UPI001176DE3C|nr:ras and Rab interactor 1-like [Salarias fasciatus]
MENREGPEANGQGHTEQMAQQEPLYDFPEPSQASQRKILPHQRGQGSLRSISVLDRLLLTVPVWLQLSINPATALHILRREPPGTFIIRKSRTSQRNVLCVRLADDSVPSFVQQFGIKEEQSSKTLCLETSAISFPDLPRLIAFYCVSRDVLPFPLELPEAIGRATSHKELESISHLGIEFWNSHLNVRGPREPPKPQTDKEKKNNLDAVPLASPAPVSQPVPVPTSNPASTLDSDKLLSAAPEPEAAAKQPGPGNTLFQEFCPITTRSPQELDCGAGLGALCFINPLFLQSQNALSRQRILKRSLKIRISTETSSLLSPPLAAPPPPPLVPKAKRKCKAQKENAELYEEVQPTPIAPGETQEPVQSQTEPGQSPAEGAAAQLPAGTELFPSDCDYMTPPPAVNVSHSPSLSPYMSPAASPMPPLLCPKASPSRSPRESPSVSPSLSPYQSPSLPHRAPPFSLSPYHSPNLSPSGSPRQSPSPSPVLPPSLPPFTAAASSQPSEQADSTYATPTSLDQRRAGVDEKEEIKDVHGGGCEEQEDGLALQMSAASLNDSESRSPEAAAQFSSVMDNNTSLEQTN